jgi:uncharacterized membrane protein YvlD (DUF360 family)
VKPSVAVGLRLAWRFAAIWLIETVALLAFATHFPGVTYDPQGRSLAILASAFLVAFALSGVNTLIQPLLILLRVPINVLTLGLAAIAANVITLHFAATWMTGFDIEPFFPNALLAALVMSAINIVLTALIALDDEYAFFQFAMHVIARERRIRRPRDAQSACGMVLVQIDGLSPQRLDDAMQAGYMPTLKSLFDSGTHTISTYDCGLPSQTSSCQAGILYGENGNIPAFRWYDKQLGRMIVSNHPSDANLINNNASTGRGLLRGGSSINNLVNGDAAKSLLTMSTLSGQSKVPTVRAIDDLGSFWFNPYTFTRTLAGSFGDIVVEAIESARQFVRNEQPRLDRLFNGQVFLRVLTNIFMRDLSAYAMMLDIVRGVPVMYTTFMGYDQVAHHAGPDSADALRTLRGLDKQLRHILQTIRRLAPRPYELYILSDHGQAFGATFRQRYGHDLRDLVDHLTEQSTAVEQMRPEGDKRSYVAALISELQAANEQLSTQPKTRFRRAVMRQATRTLARQSPAPEPVLDHRTPGEQPTIVVCVSGNLAHLYFSAVPGKLTLGEVERRHPELVRGLVTHAGIGFVAGYDDEGNALVLGKHGARNLNTGAVTGQDPLADYGDADVRAAQILRMAEFPNAGDLILNSTVYEGGTVASFEDLVGVHGGLGGQQTDAFIMHPAEVPLRTQDIINSAQVYDVLNRQRDICPEPATAAAVIA